MLKESNTYLISSQALAAWEIPQTYKSSIYLFSTIVPLLLSLSGYAYMNQGNVVIRLLFIILSGCFFWRLFVIFHDLVHGNYFKNVLINNTLGWITGVILFTPFKFWKRDHLLHHATTGNLDRRGYGEIKTLTVEEFQKLSKYQKLKYQIYRNPVFLFVIAPLLLFLFRHRVAWRNWHNEKMSIYSTNLAIVGIAATTIYLWGWQTYVFGYLASLYLGFCIVAWFFYVQHHYENTYYSTANSWSYAQGALQGSSFYKLPKIINAFTINIGYHHIHHFNSRIPSYNLHEVFNRFPIFQNSPTFTIKTSIGCVHANLWDTQKNKMVSFRSLKK